MFVITDVTVPVDTVTKPLFATLTPSGDVERIPAIAKANGWQSLNGQDADENAAPRYTRIKPFTFQNRTYFIAQPGNGDPEGIVIAPKPDGTVEKSCVFQRVRPHL